jgi:hypothetical protein
VVPNAKQKVPYTLPANKTKSSFRTNTHKGQGFNELTFEDGKGREEIYMHAQRDNRIHVGNSRSKRVDNNQSGSVGHNKNIEVGNNHHEVMFGEVKANTARLSDDQSFFGGPRYVQDRLERVRDRRGEWANATAQQRADAKRALEWLKQNPKFKEMKYDVDPKTGKATNYRGKDWDYPKGQRPKKLKWRDGEGNEVKRKKKPKKKPTTTGPPPATPAYGPQ